MEEIIRAQSQVVRSKQRLQDAVTAARAQGRTWQEIGEALDMTRQAAFKRFGKPSKPKEMEHVEPQPVEPILELAERAFGLVASAGYDQLHRLMTSSTRQSLSADLMAATWTEVLAEVGEFESCNDTRAELPDGTPLDLDESILGATIVATTLQCEAGDLVGRVAFDGERNITGMLIVPPGHGDLPF